MCYNCSQCDIPFNEMECSYEDNACVVAAVKQFYQPTKYVRSCKTFPLDRRPERTEQYICKRMWSLSKNISHCRLKICFSDLCNSHLNLLMSARPDCQNCDKYLQTVATVDKERHHYFRNRSRKVIESNVLCIVILVGTLKIVI